MQTTLTGRARVGKQVGLASVRDNSCRSGNDAEVVVLLVHDRQPNLLFIHFSVGDCLRQRNRI
ncbi:MAG: hypothetical protein Q8J79_05040 [Erythrobacter sp.]|nr:hypothetical protein [Erythrobacter sp.]